MWAVLIFIRFGEEPDFDQRHPLVKTFSIPSQTLKALNLEILIRDISPTTRLPDKGDNSYLIPGLSMPIVNADNTSAILYPVHKALVYADGLNNMSLLPTTGSQGANFQRGMVQGVIDGKWKNLDPESASDQNLSPINLAEAESAIDSFRKSVDMGLEYEHAWFGSGLAHVSTWLGEGLGVETSILKPTLRRLIETLSNNVEQAILEEEEAFRRQLAVPAVSTVARDDLSQGLQRWVKLAHTDLLGFLEYAFSTHSWKRLAWWKLFWRVDDVGFITANVLQRAWLVEAEKEMIWLLARIMQANAIPGRPFPPPPKLESRTLKIGDDPLRPAELDLLNESNTDFKAFPNPSCPWSREISLARSSLSRTTIPRLQALSQTLVLQTVSTTALTSFLAVLVYISVSTTSIYEAGAIAAIGFTYSIQRLQKGWSRALEDWKETVREEGRTLLRGAEDELNAIIMEERNPNVDEREVENRRMAKEAVERVRRALEEISLRIF